MEHLVEHPVELSFEELLGAAMDRLDPDTSAFGIARMVLAEPDCLSTLTTNQQYHWKTFVEPAMGQEVERRNEFWRKYLMDRAG